MSSSLFIFVLKMMLDGTVDCRWFFASQFAQYNVDFGDLNCIQQVPETTQIWIPVSAKTNDGEVMHSSDLIGAAVILTTITHLKKAFQWHLSGLKHLEFTHDLTHGVTLEGRLKVN